MLIYNNTSTLNELLHEIESFPRADIKRAETMIIEGTCENLVLDGITTVGNSAFYCCSSLTTVNFPECTTIGESAFYSCTNLAMVSFPQCVTINEQAFYNCVALSEVYLMGSSVCTLVHSNAFNSPNIFVPASLVTAYKSASNWSYFSNRIFGLEVE